MVAQLDRYQEDGASFLALSRRAILADDVGLGKTAQAIRACDLVRARRVLILTRKSLTLQWLAEIRRFTNTGEAVLYNPSRPLPPARFLVTNYEAVTRHPPQPAFDALIVDEATAIKNRKAKRTKAVYGLAKYTPYLFLLTATPIHNRPEELWSLLHAIDTKRYSSYWRFVETYCYVYETPWARKVVGVRDVAGLREEIAPYMLRRDKTLLNLPPTSHETVRVGLEQEQQRIYQQMQRLMYTLLEDETSVMAPTVLAQLTRLRQIACSPALIGGPDRSGKTAALLELLEDLADDRKVLVFTTFAEYAKLLHSALQTYSPALLVGDMNDTQRYEATQRFQNDTACRVLIGTTGTMAEGLNLTAASVVIFANKDWVPSANDQAEGRAHRRGQQNPVHVVSLVSAGTVDEYLEEVLQQKQTVIDAVIRHVAHRIREEGRR